MMNNPNPRVLEAWFTLMSEAMRGTRQAREAFEMLPKMTGNDEMTKWLNKFMPSVMSSTSGMQPEAFEMWLEDWQRVTGVVPRARYLELLERCDQLQRRLERAEDTIKKLRTMISSKEQTQEEAKKVVDMWSQMLEDTVKMQSEWIHNWTEPGKKPSTASSESEKAESDKENPETKNSKS